MACGSRGHEIRHRDPKASASEAGKRSIGGEMPWKYDRSTE
jgi:hypothetical protein